MSGSSRFAPQSRKKLGAGVLAAIATGSSFLLLNKKGLLRVCRDEFRPVIAALTRAAGVLTFVGAQ